MTGKDPSFGSVGFHQVLFTIEEITNGYAYGTDQFLVSRQVPIALQRAKGAAPSVGEQWLITKDLGPWTFAAIMSNPAQSAGFTTIDVHGNISGFPGAPSPAVLTVLLPDGFTTGFGEVTGPFVGAPPPSLVADEDGLETTPPNQLGYGILTLDGTNTVLNGVWMTSQVDGDSIITASVGPRGTATIEAQSGFASMYLEAAPMSAVLRTQGTGSGADYSLMQMNNGSGNGNLMVGQGSPLSAIPTDGDPSIYFDAAGGTAWQNLDTGGSDTTWTELTFGGGAQLPNYTSPGAGITITDNSYDGIIINAEGAGNNVQLTGTGYVLIQDGNGNLVDLGYGSTGGLYLISSAGGTYYPGITIQTSGAGGINIESSDVLTLSGTTVSLGSSSGVTIGQTGDYVGFFGYTPRHQPAITGSRGGNAALASLLSALDSIGLIADTSTP
jgi:hypothetical protein